MTARRLFLAAAGLALAQFISSPWARTAEAESGSSVIVVFNSAARESRQVAEHYARRRFVPDSQVFGLALPETESMTRTEFLEKLQQPLLEKLQSARLMVFESTAGTPPSGARRFKSALVRYLVLCYGVPSRILPDASLVEPDVEKLPPELRRNGASVDSQLACLPGAGETALPWTGPLRNPAYNATNAAQLHPTNGVLMVTRLDGPTAAVAQQLVDKALTAEREGLWGRAYVDARGLTNTAYLRGDQWMLAAAEIMRRTGFETVLDTNAATFGAGFPMSQVALYAGWYDGGASGPFSLPTVEFLPGAFAYHLHSFSAATIRSSSANWVGPLLAKGASCTIGYVDEPYLVGTVDLGAFFFRLLAVGFSFGEAAYAAHGLLSWQSVIIGDPLYRPFAQRPDVLHAQLEKRGSPRVEWSHLRVVNLNLATGARPSEAVSYLEKMPATRTSAVLTEKLADLYWAAKNFTDALDTYELALTRGPSPQQKVRLLLTLARQRAEYNTARTALVAYQRFVKEVPDYPDLLTIYREMHRLAEQAGDATAVERSAEEIKKRTRPNP